MDADRVLTCRPHFSEWIDRPIRGRLGLSVRDHQPARCSIPTRPRFRPEEIVRLCVRRLRARHAGLPARPRRSGDSAATQGIPRTSVPDRASRSHCDEGRIVRARLARSIHQRRNYRELYQACPSGSWGRWTRAEAHSDPQGFWLSVCRQGGGTACADVDWGDSGHVATLDRAAAAKRHGETVICATGRTETRHIARLHSRGRWR